MMHATIDILKTKTSRDDSVSLHLPHQCVERPHSVREAKDSALPALVHVLRLFFFPIVWSTHFSLREV